MHPLFTSLICLLPQSLVRLVILLCLCSLRVAQWRLCRISWGCLEYLIHWEVYSPEERSWDNILDQTLLAIFHVNHSSTQMDGSSDVLGLQSGAWDCHSTSHSLYFHFPFNLTFTGLTKNYHWPLLQCYSPHMVDYSLSSFHCGLFQPSSSSFHCGLLPIDCHSPRHHFHMAMIYSTYCFIFFFKQL